MESILKDEKRCPGCVRLDPRRDAAPKAEEAPAVTAPLVGTFYAAPSPEQPRFVTEGDRVKKGQTVCVLEAMKMENDIVAPENGTVKQLLVSKGSTVNTDDVLAVLG